eukprot:CCRYP_006373-RA/>CCRYP_006373-RA protein AED:0.00 eAED:0.00 QI:36/1/1/1/0/0/2/3/57
MGETTTLLKNLMSCEGRLLRAGMIYLRQPRTKVCEWKGGSKKEVGKVSQKVEFYRKR